MSSRLASRLWTVALVLRRVLSRERRSRPQVLRRILVAHHLRLGDALMLTALLAKIRHNHPQAEIVLTAPKHMAALYATRPYGVTAITYDPRDLASARALAQVADYDLAIVPGDNRYTWLAFALGARWIVAFSGDRPAYKNWLADELIALGSMSAAWADLMADLVPGEAPPPYDPQHWPVPPARPFPSPPAPYVVLHVGASSELKLWNPERWRAVAEHLAGQGFEIVWSAGAGEGGSVREIDPDGRFCSYAGTLDLCQLWHLLAGARLLIAPDTGIAHLGRIVGTPTIALFGPGSPILYGRGEFWRNSRYWALAVDPFPCRDQRILFNREVDWVRRCARSTQECADNRCMQALDASRVLAAVDLALQQYGYSVGSTSARS